MKDFQILEIEVFGITPHEETKYEQMRTGPIMVENLTWNTQM